MRHHLFLGGAGFLVVLVLGLVLVSPRRASDERTRVAAPGLVRPESRQRGSQPQPRPDETTLMDPEAGGLVGGEPDRRPEVTAAVAAHEQIRARAARRLPDDGEELLAMGLPEVLRVAEIMGQAGVAHHDLTAHLRAIYGHVQRLEMFHDFGRRDAEKLASVEAEAALDPARDTGEAVGLRLLAKFWPGQEREYQEHVRNHFASGLGVTNEAVIQQIFELARSRPPEEPRPPPRLMPLGGQE